LFERPLSGPFLLVLLLCAAARAFAQEPSVSGQAGLISMPDARFAPEGTWRSGVSFLRPYETLWSNVTVMQTRPMAVERTICRVHNTKMSG